MQRARFTILSDAGTIYSWLETDEYWGDNEFESRYGRLPHQRFTKEQLEEPSNPMFGALESLGQSDDCPPFLYKEGIVAGAITWLGEDNDRAEILDTSVSFA